MLPRPVLISGPPLSRCRWSSAASVSGTLPECLIIKHRRCPMFSGRTGKGTDKWKALLIFDYLEERGGGLKKKRSSSALYEPFAGILNRTRLSPSTLHYSTPHKIRWRTLWLLGHTVAVRHQDQRAATVAQVLLTEWFFRFWLTVGLSTRDVACDLNVSFNQSHNYVCPVDLNIQHIHLHNPKDVRTHCQKLAHWSSSVCCFRIGPSTLCTFVLNCILKSAICSTDSQPNQHW